MPKFAKLRHYFLTRESILKGLAIRLIVALALLLWTWDMVFPWQKAVLAEENRYTQIQQRSILNVGVLNHPISYFVSAEGESGLEYELTKQFADYLGVKLNVQMYDSPHQLFEALENNKIDLAAAGLFYQDEMAKKFQIGAGYYSASWQVVYQKGNQRPYSIADLNNEIVVSSGSSALPLLEQLAKQNPNLKWKSTDQYTQEELMFQVAEGKIPYTVAVSVDVSAAQHIKPNIAIGFDLTDEKPMVWYLPNNTYSELQAHVLEFMNYANENGIVSRLEEKYFSHLSSFDFVDSKSYLNAIEKVLPKYQTLFEKYKGDLEWQMLAAIAYQESHWNPTATSPTGVRGIMMLTKDTADRMKVSNRIDPEQSIRGGAEYLHLLLKQLPETIKEEDRIWFALAAYNMGYGHLIDVRRLTKQLGGDPDDWLNVKKNLPLLAEKQYYRNLKYGYARGFEALQYVENIRRYYNSIMNYQRITAPENEKGEEQANQQIEIMADEQNSSINNEIPSADISTVSHWESKLVEWKNRFKINQPILISIPLKEGIHNVQEIQTQKENQTTEK